jgi:alpha-L-fucosidase 2
MFDAHPPFQIDGNFGCTAGIAEMLIQSHQMVSRQSKESTDITFGQQEAIEGYDAEPHCLIETLPALPDEWSKGEVTGLRCRGGFVITRMKWADGKVTKLEILSEQGNTLFLKLNGEIREFPTYAGERINIQNPTRVVTPLD